MRLFPALGMVGYCPLGFSTHLFLVMVIHFVVCRRSRVNISSFV
uniref:Uncharacterized protein n=1 Tax=Anguilla anguilla TaxID=7936 RepID=A0A0E9UYL9_ANGAN